MLHKRASDLNHTLYPKIWAKAGRYCLLLKEILLSRLSSYYLANRWCSAMDNFYSFWYTARWANLLWPHLSITDLPVGIEYTACTALFLGWLWYRQSSPKRKLPLIPGWRRVVSTQRYHSPSRGTGQIFLSPDYFNIPKMDNSRLCTDSYTGIWCSWYKPLSLI